MLFSAFPPRGWGVKKLVLLRAWWKIWPGKSQECGWGRIIGLPPVGSRDEYEVQEQTPARISRDKVRMWGRTSKALSDKD